MTQRRRGDGRRTKGEPRAGGRWLRPGDEITKVTGLRTMVGLGVLGRRSARVMTHADRALVVACAPRWESDAGEPDDDLVDAILLIADVLYTAWVGPLRVRVVSRA